MKNFEHEVRVRINGSQDHWKKRIERLRKKQTGSSRLANHDSLSKVHGMNSDLYRAASRGDINGLLDLFESFDQSDAQHSLLELLDQTSPQLNTVLHLLLLSRSYAPKDIHHNSQVHHVIEFINNQCPALLTKTNYEGDTALHIAARGGHVEEVNVFIQGRKDHACLDGNILLIQNGLRNTPLHEALLYHHLAVAELLFNAAPEACNYANGEGKCPLYLAAKEGYEGLVEKMLDVSLRHDALGKSPVDAAVKGKKIEVLKIIYKKQPALFRLKDEENRTPLHWAAYEGYLDGVHFILEHSTLDIYEADKNGSYPIHLASSEDHVDIIQQLVKYCPDSKELLNGKGQNIFHVAAARGKFDVVNYLLKGLEHVKLMNDKDAEGQTPLHLAIIHCRPRIAFDLVMDKRIDMTVVNNEGSTALDIAERCWQRQASFREVLMFVVLKSSGAVKTPRMNISEGRKEGDGKENNLHNIQDKYKDKVSTIMLVATLVATVTFAAGFTVPGGTDILGPHVGRATMLDSWYFSMFVICDNIALYSSVTVVITLMWAQLGDIRIASSALKLAFPLLGISLTTMSLAFAAGVYLVVKMRNLKNEIRLRISGSDDEKSVREIRRKIQKLREYNGNSEHICHDMFTESHAMDPRLYRAASSGNPTGFLDLFQPSDSKHTQLSLSVLCRQVSPQMNTVLHLLILARAQAQQPQTDEGFIDLIDFIVEECPALLFKTNSEGDTALHIAARAGSLPEINALIHHQKDRTRCKNMLVIENEAKNTALHEALRNRHREVAEVLVQAGPELSYILNGEGKCPLYLAAEAGYEEIVEKMLHARGGIHKPCKSPLHAAIISENTGVLKKILDRKPEIFKTRDEEGNTPLHWAASKGYLEGVQILLGYSTLEVYETEKNSSYPIHLAASEGHLEIIEMLLKKFPDSKELLNGKGQNILHVAAMRGKFNIVSYLLKGHEHEKMINQKDIEGNTPLHLAVLHFRPRIVHHFTQDKRVKMCAVDSSGSTPLDIAERKGKSHPTFRQAMMLVSLKSAGAKRSRGRYTINVPANPDEQKEKINNILLVATLIATITFTAGFTLPGGVNVFEPNAGTATMLRNWHFSVFVLCDNIAMYSSVIVAITLIWAQLGDIYLAHTALKLAFPLLGLSLATMSFAFASGAYLVVSDLHWLADLIWTLGLLFLLVLVLIFVPLWFPFSSRSSIINAITHYPVWLMLRSDKFNLDQDLEE
ncbi:Ankyrin repeat [Dillenia turbinata]|uniref:Ankyrin repeat n=1 Tax=Dillenia turbinata TaxID=194707 RepID=A0AAN8UWT1_9MAGN